MNFSRVMPLLQLLIQLVYRYVRLELLQGVAAFHSGNSQASHHLSSALAKWQRLQVCDEALAMLASMGFTTSQVTTMYRSMMQDSSILCHVYVH